MKNLTRALLTAILCTFSSIAVAGPSELGGSGETSPSLSTTSTETTTLTTSDTSTTDILLP